MRLSPLCVFSLLAAPLASQTVRAELVTVTPYGNFAREGTQQDFASWPANTSIASAQSSIGAQAGNAFADTILGWQVWPGNIVTADVSDQGGGDGSSGPTVSGTTPSLTAVNPQQGPHELRLRILGTPGMRGKLEVWGSGVAEIGSKASLAADLYDDNSIDFRMDITPQGPFERRQWSVVLDPAGELRVRIITEASVALTSGNTVYKTGISVRFTPGSFCDLGGYGTSCGPHLIGSDDVQGPLRVFQLQLNDAVPNSPGLLLLGTQRLSTPIPGPNCLLQTDPVIVIPFAADGGGYATIRLNSPVGLPILANLQEVMITPALQVTSTNGLALICR